MSNPSSNRWREGRPQSLNAPPTHQQRQQQSAQVQGDRAQATSSPRPTSQSHAQPPSTNRAPLASQAGNASSGSNTWGAGDKGRAAVTATPTDEKMKGQVTEFNGEEVRAFLRRDTASDDAEPKKGVSASVKAGAMANGQDFWSQLRKQVTELEQIKR